MRLKPTDRLAVDLTLRTVQRAQGNIDRLMEEGVGKALADTSEEGWANFFERHRVAREAVDAAHDALEALYRAVIVAEQSR